MTRRELRERRERQRRRIRRQKIIRAVFFGVLALILLLGIFFIVRAISKKKPKVEEEVAVVAVENTTAADPNTATKQIRAGGDGKPGWNTDSNGWWYQDEDGAMYVGGWQTIDGERYYFMTDGYLAIGWLTIDGKDYYFKESGISDEEQEIKYVALTYDEGPAEYTTAVLDTLEKYDAKATFFVCGGLMGEHGDIVKEAIDSGMEIGNYTYDNGTLIGLEPLEVSFAVAITDSAIESAVGITPELFRAPGGNVDDNTRENAGKPIIGWSLTSSQIVKEKDDGSYDVSLDAVKDGSVIRLLDIFEDAPAVTKVLAEALYRDGYRMVTVSELAKARGVTLEKGKEYSSFPADGMPETEDIEEEETVPEESEETESGMQEGAAEENP